MKSIIKTIIIYSILFCSYLPSFALDVEVTNACGGGNSGSISVLLDNAPNGPFTYLWSNGANTSSIENLAAGTYDLTVYDANDCVVTQSMTVEEGIIPNFEIVDISCNYIEATATLEISPTLMLDEVSYSYSFDGETPLPLDDYFITAAGLEGGPHSLSIFDEGGCASMLSIQVPCILNCFPGVALDIETECKPVPNFNNMLFEFTAVIHYPSEYEGLITAAVINNEEHPNILPPDMLTNPLILATFIDSEDFEPYGLIQLGAEGNSDHCIHDLSLSCNHITSTEENPNTDDVAPIFLNDTNHILCYNDEAEICLPYQISDFSPFIRVHASSPTLSITK